MDENSDIVPFDDKSGRFENILTSKVTKIDSLIDYSNGQFVDVIAMVARVDAAVSDPKVTNGQSYMISRRDIVLDDETKSPVTCYLFGKKVHYKMI